MPNNLWLVPGDGNLELIAPAIHYYANALMPDSAWLNVHKWIKILIDKIACTSDWTVFIDTNPSFAIYTELAIVAGTHIIVPFKADDSSRVATKALFDLIHGPEKPHPVYSKYTFAVRAKEAGLQLPCCHLFIGNQFTQYKGSAKVFGSMSNALMKSL
ncbi:MAG: ParA family protein [Nostoc sp.]